MKVTVCILLQKNGSWDIHIYVSHYYIINANASIHEQHFTVSWSTHVELRLYIERLYVQFGRSVQWFQTYVQKVTTSICGAMR